MRTLTTDEKAQIAATRKFEKLMGKNVPYYCFKFASGKWACASFDSGNGLALRNSGGTEISMGIPVVFCVAVK